MPLGREEVCKEVHVTKFIMEAPVRRTATSFILGMAILLGFAIPASAQSGAAGGGLIRFYERNAFQLTFAVDTPVKSYTDWDVNAVGEFGLQFFDGFTQKWLGGGVRFASKKDAKVKPFGQVLIGGFFCCDASDFGLQFGGGVDMPMNNNKYTLRLQGDIPIDFFEGETEVGFRLTASIVFPFKR